MPREHPNVVKANWAGDFRWRCEVCGGLVCESCHACNGHHNPESNLTNAGEAYGRITTDKATRTLHRECRYMAELLG
jgi:hypothetical protein